MSDRILIDLDGVVVDLMGEAVARGLFQHPPCKWDFTGCCTPYSQNEMFEQSDIFLDAPMIEGALEGVATLTKALFDVRFVSTPWVTNPQSAADKYRWFEANFGDPRRLTLTHDKTLIPAFALIDDRPGLVGPWLHVEYPQAWNSRELPTWEQGLADFVIGLAP